MGLSTNAYLIIAVLALAVVVLLRLALRKPRRANATPSAKRPRQSQTKPVVRNRFRATSILTTDDACAAAQALAGKRYLVADNDVPPLPLNDCDMANCACTYVHHQDRREGGELRRAPSSLRTKLHSHTEQVEQRTQKGRRSTDWE